MLTSDGATMLNVEKSSKTLVYARALVGNLVRPLRGPGRAEKEALQGSKVTKKGTTRLKWKMM